MAVQQLPKLRVTATGGSLEGGATISVHMDDPMPLAEELLNMEVVDDVIDEDDLASHPLGDFLKRTLPQRSRKQRNAKRLLVVLHRT